MNPNSQALRDVANAIDLGTPAPVGISLMPGLIPEVQISACDVDRWSARLGIAKPIWDQKRKDGLYYAQWEPGAFAGKAFTLVAVSKPPVAVGAK